MFFYLIMVFVSGTLKTNDCARIMLQNITLQPPNPAVHIEFRPMQIKPDIFQPTSIASISFTGNCIEFN